MSPAVVRSSDEVTVRRPVMGPPTFEDVAVAPKASTLLMSASATSNLTFFLSRVVKVTRRSVSISVPGCMPSEQFLLDFTMTSSLMPPILSSSPMSGATPSEFVVEPLAGAGRARLAVGGGVLIVTDDRGRRHRFPLGGGESAPAVVIGTVGVSGPGSFAVLDGAGRAMIVTPRTLWPEAELPRLAEAA